MKAIRRSGKKRCLIIGSGPAATAAIYARDPLAPVLWD